MEKILLKNKKSKLGVNGDSFLGVSLKTNRTLLPSTSLDDVVNQQEQYDKERMNCNNLHLICSINPICSNVLFNNKTEVVLNEGSDDPVVAFYHYFGVDSENTDHLMESTLLGKNNVYPKTYTPTKLIQDTQLSQYSGITYHCGLDIFNNHILRSQTFKTVTVPKSQDDFAESKQGEYKEYDNPNSQEIYFNTIRDYLRNYHGENTKGYFDILRKDDNYQQQLSNDSIYHLYLNENIDSFTEAVEKKLIEKNGWFGFVNKPNITTYDKFDDAININKVINNKNSCEFIDMYPERQLFYFTPKYNIHRHRIEKNWNYCLTYPSSSTTDVSFINPVDGLNSIKIAVFDDDTYNSSAIESILIISTCKHGLQEQDIVNIYETISGTTNELRINGVFVNEVVDDYTFYINKNGNSLVENDNNVQNGGWVDMTDTKILSSYTRVAKYVYSSGTKIYPIINDKVNLSSNHMNFSFKKVVNSIECDYYVRIFSKLPNFKFKDRKNSEYELYKNESDMIQKYQQLEYDFESHVGKIAFANNIYGDDVSEIVFTDDIDLSNLKDNLGRPLTSIYLTILKNNRGYKDWYGYTGTTDTQNIFKSDKLNSEDLLKNNDTLEYSHCFGKLTNCFTLSYRSLINKELNNTRRVSNVNGDDKIRCSSGLNYSNININRPTECDEDEVIYRYYDSKSNQEYTNGDTNFYGDVVCFSPSEYLETSLQMSDFRFNTAQRDGYGSKVGDSIMHDEIVFDDYDANPNGNENFSAVTLSYSDALERKEGYYYTGHYEIPIKSHSNNLIMQAPKFYSPMSITRIDDNGTFVIKTLEKTYFEVYDKIFMYDTDLAEVDEIEINGKVKKLKECDKYFELTIKKVNNRRIFSANNTNGVLLKSYTLNGENRYFYQDKFIIFKPDETIPQYAKLLEDKSFNYVWREVIQNGYDTESDIEVYPFTNNALYVNNFINFYLKRQDPNNYVKDYSWDGYSLQSNTYPFDINLKKVDIDNENNYFEEEDIRC